MLWAVEQNCRLRGVARHSRCRKDTHTGSGAWWGGGQGRDARQAAAGIAKTEQEKLSSGKKNGQEATGDS